ncbi:hypothetical protein [Fusobacterium perfoetens]|uniref:hypothetical protein n=1 Tax=Fusobacterium perfoetens TaxID=852 RepID=UPI001F43AD88|nr:hypothetical protein [Fusobacterium perfoetens]MCF2611649.1 hypothetical protein [Fusobacterium perfoetens]
MADYTQNTKANLPHLSQSYSSPFDSHPVFSQIGGWVCDENTADLKYKLNKTDWSKKADGSPSNLDGTDGDVMVKVPAFFMKVTRMPNGKPKFEIDDIIPDEFGSNGKPGFFVHPAFKMSNGKVRPYFLWGAYPAFEKSGKLRSISGVLPTTSKNKGDFRDLARQGRNTDYDISSVFERVAIQILFYTEFGTLDSQTACGNGIVNMTWESGTGAEQNQRITGGSDALGDRSGYLENGAYKNGKCSVRYRGIEDLWGNVYNFLTGIMVTDKGWHYTNEHSKMDTISSMTLYAKDLKEKVPNGYISDMEYPVGAEWLFLPKTTGGSATTYFCDYYYTHDPGEENVLLAGGHWDSGSFAGLAYWNCPNVASTSGVSLGARLSWAKQ